jgi:tetratricopeptide (TPR) repeat protein
VPRSQRNDNFIDKSFTVMADLILKVLPTNQRAKEAFAYYRDGMSAQADGEYAEALDNYAEALKLEEDPNDRAFILYNMATVSTRKPLTSTARRSISTARCRRPSTTWR